MKIKIKRKGGENMKIKKGFTLIELLIVIAIIGILAAVIMPSLTTAKKKAQQSNFIQSVKALQTSLVLCCDNGLDPKIQEPGTSGGEICNPSIDDVWPTGSNAAIYGGGVSISQCNYGVFSVTFTAKPGAYGDCESATVTNKGVTFKSISGKSSCTIE